MTGSCKAKAKRGKIKKLISTNAHMRGRRHKKGKNTYGHLGEVSAENTSHIVAGELFPRPIKVLAILGERATRPKTAELGPREAI